MRDKLLKTQNKQYIKVLTVNLNHGNCILKALHVTGVSGCIFKKKIGPHKYTHQSQQTKKDIYGLKKKTKTLCLVFAVQFRHIYMIMLVARSLPFAKHSWGWSYISHQEANKLVYQVQKRI